MEEAPGRVVFEVPCPELALGPHRFDIRCRAVLVARLDGSLLGDRGALVARAQQLVAAGADALELGDGPQLGPAVEALRAELDAPVLVATGDALALEQALTAGAAAGIDPTGLADPDYLPVAASAGASVVVLPGLSGSPDVTRVARGLRERAEQAETAGIPRHRVLVDAGLDLTAGGPALRLLRAHDCLAALGWPLSRAVRGAANADPAAVHAAISVGIALGARLLRVGDVHGARRTADVLAAILDARQAVPA